MTSHEATDMAKQAQEALLKALEDAGGEGKADELMRTVLDRHPRLTLEIVKGAIWALASQGVIEVGWRSEVREKAPA